MDFQERQAASHEYIKLGKLRYALFVPRGLASVSKATAWKPLLAKLPLATLETNGQFFERLKTAAGDAKIDLKIRLACSSFPQAARALETGRFAAILPKLAEVELSEDEFAQIPVPFLKDEVRELHLIWNRRQIQMKPEFDRFRRILARLLTF